jgi:hypothetical protein
MRACIIDGSAVCGPGANAVSPSGNTLARRQNFLIHADETRGNVTSLFAPGRFLLTAADSKELAMSRKPHSLSKQLVVATALALGASSVALADDSSMNPFTGDSYKYFKGGPNSGDPGQVNRPAFGNAPATPSWRQGHPNGLTEPELQALSSSGLSASASQLSPPVLASAPADPSWRRSHPNGPSEPELQALSSSTLAIWQIPNGSQNTASASTGPANVAQTPSKTTFSARLAGFFHRVTDAQTRAY